LDKGQSSARLLRARALRVGNLDPGGFEAG